MEGAYNFTLFCFGNFIGVGRIIGNMYVMAASGRIQNDNKQTKTPGIPYSDEVEGTLHTRTHVYK